MKDKIVKAMALMRLMWIAAGVPWKDTALNKDLNRWGEILHLQGSKKQILALLLRQYPEFRNLFIYRNRFRPIYKRWVAWIYPPMDTLFLQAGEIGGGLFIQHGFSTMVTAQSIGENCWINQQVTIGYNGHGKAPVIGNNVMITCGAKVLGEITVGDNAIIGANAVVIRDVEENAVMGGVPARRLK